MHSVVETPTYLRSARSAGMTPDEMLEAVRIFSETPTAGALIEGTGGARKVRLARRGKGKSGGYRIITYYAAADIPVFLLDVYAKGTKVNVSKSERNELKELLGGLAKDYRESVHGMAQRRKGRGQ